MTKCHTNEQPEVPVETGQAVPHAGYVDGKCKGGNLRQRIRMLFGIKSCKRTPSQTSQSSAHHNLTSRSSDVLALPAVQSSSQGGQSQMTKQKAPTGGSDMSAEASWDLGTGNAPQSSATCEGTTGRGKADGSSCSKAETSGMEGSSPDNTLPLEASISSPSPSRHPSSTSGHPSSSSDYPSSLSGISLTGLPASMLSATGGLPGAIPTSKDILPPVLESNAPPQCWRFDCAVEHPLKVFLYTSDTAGAPPVRVVLVALEPTPLRERLAHAEETPVSFILPSDPPQSDVRLDMDLATDIQFPINSFIGSGAFGQVGCRHEAL